MPYDLIDTHCHLAFNAFDDSWKEVVSRAREKRIAMIAVGAARETSEKSIQIAAASTGVYAAIGLHPTHVEDEDFFVQGESASGAGEAWCAKLATHPSVVAIGECGIDHYRIDQERRDEILAKQEVLLQAHVQIAQEHALPLILHTRDGQTESHGQAYSHLYRLLKEYGYYNGVLHCFGGSWDEARQFLDLGFFISFTGIVTFKNATEELKEVVRKVPQDRFMLETDSPYLAPQAYRGKTNEPAYVSLVARTVAQIRGEDYTTVAAYTTQNAVRFFGI